MASRLGRIPATWWFKSAAAGVVGGIAMVLAWNIGSALLGMGFWTPLNTIGATLPEPGPVPGTFEAVTITGGFLHALTSACWGIVYGALVGLVFPRYARSWGLSAIAGLVFGLGVFLVMGELIGPWLNPTIMAIYWVNYLVGHVVFGLVTALAFHAMVRRRELTVTFAPERTAARRAPLPHP